MDKEMVIQNILNNYGKYGIKQEDIEPVIASGVSEGLSYDLIYLTIKAELSKLVGEEFHCTSSDMARAFGLTEEEVNQMIEKSREELIASGENPDDYFKEVQTTTFMM